MTDSQEEQPLEKRIHARCPICHGVREVGWVQMEGQVGEPIVVTVEQPCPDCEPSFKRDPECQEVSLTG
uniref:Uncharacterized protein n=1 Tax=viral metagenome TaxID=1070528 RepID=A0A6M3JA40_9ZZZZ